MSTTARPFRYVGGTRVAHYWRRREFAWRAQHIRSPFSGAPFDRHDYARLWVEQRGMCGVCAKAMVVEADYPVEGYGFVGTGTGISVDHSHSHGFARALVHGLCNRHVSTMSAEQAREVVVYIEKHLLAMEDAQRRFDGRAK